MGIYSNWKCIVLCCFALLCAILGFSQNSKIDSLKSLINSSSEDSSKVNYLVALSMAYQDFDLDETIRLGIEAEKLANKLDFKKGQAYALKAVGIGNFYKANYPEAVVQYQNSLIIFESIGFKPGIANILGNLGLTYSITGDDSKALDFYLRGLRIAEEINDVLRRAYLLNNIGGVYNNKPATRDKALDYMIRAFQLMDQDPVSKAITAANIGEIYEEKKRYDSAITYFNSSLEIDKESINATFALSHLAEIYSDLKDYDKALQYHHDAVKICEEMDAKFELSQCFIGLGKTYFKQGKTSSAIEYYVKAQQLAEEVDAKNELRDIYEALSGFYSKTGDYKQAYTYEALFNSVKDSLYNTYNDKKIQALQFNFDLEKKEAQNQLQGATIERQKTINIAAGIFLISLVIITLVTIRFFQVRKSHREKRKANEVLQAALNELKATQAQLIQSEKMASLGELTAGIAHEIQNPLNFVNNFSDLNKELISELREEIRKGNSEEADLIARDIEENAVKISHHGRRAEGIVKGMLQHSRTSTGQKELTDINTLADEYIRLAYHGLRAKDKSFNARFETNLDPLIPKINVIGQDIGRVLLNLINNAFYAVTERKKLGEAVFEPTVIVSTRKLGNKIEVRVKDNGNGIPESIKAKIFQPFFTTKPTGQGTGLGLSLSFDIVKAHGGEIKVETKEGEGSEFTFYLPA